MARVNDLEWRDEIYAAADKWRDKCFYEDGSLFSDEKLWTLENIQALHNYTKNFEASKDKEYLEKLEEHLKNAPQQVIALDAQIHWFLYLFPLGKTIPTATANIRAQTKRENINKILSWANITLPQNIPDHLLTDELLGIGSSGAEFNKQRYKAHEYFLRLLIAFKGISSNQKKRFATIDDPQTAWDFAEWLDNLSGPRNTMMRNALLFFLYPDYFERMISSKDKTNIVKHFRIFLPDTTIGPSSSLLETDKALYEIRQKLEFAYPDIGIDFYLEPIQNKNGDWFDAEIAHAKFKNAGQLSPSGGGGHSAAHSESGKATDSDALRLEELEAKALSSQTEGDKRLVTHYVRERAPQLRKAKLNAVIKQHGHLKCECCGTFADTYKPEIRRSVFEVHHRRPLSEGMTTNGVADLALLCANCHSALHAATPLPTVDQFRSMLKNGD